MNDQSTDHHRHIQTQRPQQFGEANLANTGAHQEERADWNDPKHPPHRTQQRFVQSIQYPSGRIARIAAQRQRYTQDDRKDDHPQRLTLSHGREGVRGNQLPRNL